MLPGFDLRSIEFDTPERLWLLVIPAVLLLVWLWQARGRLRDRQAIARRRIGPRRESIPLLGGLAFWLLVLGASALTITALAGPHAVISIARTAGIDLIVLQDGSASMRVADVPGTRWKRSTTFLRQLAETVRWREDRMAMAVFARIATPQVRLTKDPNTFFFFLDHLADDSPFRQDDDTTWDTNIENGIYWGMRLLQKDEELHGRSPNAKAFVLISDGQAWSGLVERAINLARERGIPIFVIGVGTSAGGTIPEAPPPPDQLGPAPGRPAPPKSPPVHATLDRASLSQIASRGGGRYFELDREPDVNIAAEIIDATRKRAGTRGLQQDKDDLHWPLLAGAAMCLGLGVLLLKERTELMLCAAGTAAVLWLMAGLL